MLRGAHLAIGCPVLSKDRFPLASSKAQPAHSVHAPRAHALLPQSSSKARRGRRAFKSQGRNFTSAACNRLRIDCKV